MSRFRLDFVAMSASIRPKVRTPRKVSCCATWEPVPPRPTTTMRVAAIFSWPPRPNRSSCRSKRSESILCFLQLNAGNGLVRGEDFLTCVHADRVQADGLPRIRDPGKGVNSPAVDQHGQVGPAAKPP